MAGKKRLHCKWCNWSTNWFYTTKDEKTRGPDMAWGRLRQHAVDAHGQEMTEDEEFEVASSRFGNFDRDVWLTDEPAREPSLLDEIDDRDDWEDLTW